MKELHGICNSAPGSSRLWCTSLAKFYPTMVNRRLDLSLYIRNHTLRCEVAVAQHAFLWLECSRIAFLIKKQELERPSKNQLFAPIDRHLPGTSPSKDEPTVARMYLYLL